MNRARLEWVMSGLKQYALTPGEDLFVKTILADFDRNQALTEQQEERLEKLYKEKSKLTPTKKANQSSIGKISHQKTKFRMPRGKVF